MTIKFFLTTFKLILIIFNCSYFIGIIWIVFADAVERLSSHEEENDLGLEEDHGEDTFIDAYHIYSYEKTHQMIIPMYYAFTSLSTVGFGDYHPKSNSERIFCSIILLFGVMIFSYIMGVFIEMIDSYKMRSLEFGDEDNLSKFFFFLRKFNYGKPIDQNLQ